MCGIFVILQSKKDAIVLRKLGINLSNKLKHRGPDWSGIHLQTINTENDQIINVLTHQRLSIVDPFNGAQPLFNQDKTVCLSVNGEIWNHKVYREKYAKTYEFQTGSDCEPILPLYEEYGVNFIDKLDGIFSFVISDEKKNFQIAARDPIGVCPLYIGWTLEGATWFASELKALTNDCIRCEEFPPGHYWDSETRSFTRYYKPLWLSINPSIVNSNNYLKLDLNQLNKLLEKSVVKRLMCDVPFGVLLSGGLDSSIIASIVCRHSAKRVEDNELTDSWFPKIHTFSIGLENSPDLEAAKKVAKYLKTIHHEFHFTIQQGLDAISDVIYYIETYDLTTVRASIPMFLLSRYIKSMGIKMVLSGEGSDEIFGGYLYFHKAPSAEEFQREICDKICQLSKYDCLRANKSTSAWGLEVRVPFLDKNFLDYTMRIDPSEKMINVNENKIEKYILRKAFDCKENPYLPDNVLWRQKEQFSDGVGYAWIDALKSHAEQHVSDIELKNAKFLFPINTPTNKESYLYRTIFNSHFPHDSDALTVPGGPSIACSTARAVEWDLKWSKMADPSGRAIIDVHCNSNKEISA